MTAEYSRTKSLVALAIMGFQRAVSYLHGELFRGEGPTHSWP